MLKDTWYFVKTFLPFLNKLLFWARVSPRTSTYSLLLSFFTFDFYHLVFCNFCPFCHIWVNLSHFCAILFGLMNLSILYFSWSFGMSQFSDRFDNSCSRYSYWKFQSCFIKFFPLVARYSSNTLSPFPPPHSSSRPFFSIELFCSLMKTTPLGNFWPKFLMENSRGWFFPLGLPPKKFCCIYGLLTLFFR